MALVDYSAVDVIVCRLPTVQLGLLSIVDTPLTCPPYTVAPYTVENWQSNS